MPSISEDDRLKALGLWVLATDAYSKTREAEAALKRFLPECAEDRISDSIYSENRYTVSVFDDALAAAGITIDPAHE